MSRRTLAPFGRRTAPVTAVESVGAYTVISACDSDGPRDPRPGQFYMLSAAERWGGGADERPYLPRAFSFARIRGDGTLDFMLEAIGPGTQRLAELRPGEGLGLLGPLGIGFDATAPGRALLVGGGIGAAPLVALQDELGADARVLLGFRSGAHAEAAGLFFASDPAVVTDDGSVGRQALVTELLREELDRGSAATVFACGPPPMLEAVRALCAERAVPAQLALESGMACGYGACFGCVVPTRDGYKRLCVDGPVLDGTELETALIAGTGH
ncbi:MAG: dihydroorotate dehydrogenase electron transfer subunit [Thermoleophilaceae bacterium]|nr:dihydroorotate dehydrogenase electron transfer subunit [Thermoleophilaceae bacterium]